MPDGLGGSGGFTNSELALAGLAWRGTATGKGCSICLRAICVQDAAFVLPCHSEHCFHESCIEPWLRQSPSCPVCRQDCRSALKAQFDWPLEEPSREFVFPEDGFGTWSSRDLFSHEFASEVHVHSDSDDARDQDRTFGHNADPRSYQSHTNSSPTVARLHQEVHDSRRMHHVTFPPGASNVSGRLADRVVVRPRIQAQSVAASLYSTRRPASACRRPARDGARMHRSSSGAKIHQEQRVRPSVSNVNSASSSVPASSTASTCASHSASCSSSVCPSSFTEDGSSIQMSVDASLISSTDVGHHADVPQAGAEQQPPAVSSLNGHPQVAEEQQRLMPRPPCHPRAYSSPSHSRPQVAPTPRARLFRPASRRQEKHLAPTPSEAKVRSVTQCSTCPGLSGVEEDQQHGSSTKSPIIGNMQKGRRSYEPPHAPQVSRATSGHLEKLVAAGMPHSSWVFDSTKVSRTRRAASAERQSKVQSKPAEPEHERMLMGGKPKTNMPREASSLFKTTSPITAGQPVAASATTIKAWEPDRHNWEQHDGSPEGSIRNRFEQSGLRTNPSEWEICD